MQGMAFTEAAVFIHLQPVGGGFFVFARDVIPSFAFGTGQSYRYAHFGTSLIHIAKLLEKSASLISPKSGT